ncbi:biotin/lipoyl-binding protein [Gammaproteobacteria bacterium]|nr:biotin/lipoyl-binding protein [Gammaproteobacteria bacterium]MDA9575314.1 biotin/lipoyl-binding protein [Gammaproteobacteria bacterium]MDC3411424.1 biotin/lipoyl-binding protein [Gammaproteobacteria bacterium]
MIFSSILIANRGEIACRIIQTAHQIGIHCIAVYVDDDRESPYVKMADQSIRLPDGGYLDGKEIIRAAKESGAQAIHPGYGFLSENAAFARTVVKEGLIWIGPSAHAISIMGDKLKAKELAEKASVPTLPMTSKSKDANKIGYPLLIKAAAGGGGKGMRIVHKSKDLNEAIKSAQREAKSGFGDERIFIERYVEKSRHIEIQILCDTHGNTVHLGERECSIQRRHQKIIEESPSPRISEDIRNKMGDAAVKLAKKIKYQSAGTVEFLFDDKTEEFWFLEVNTRLQVEHPVTEEVTGIDIVSEQLRIARGEELGYFQDDIDFIGHSIEARLYAEDPNNNFLPEIGKLIAFEPGYNDDTRWDSGVTEGSEIGTKFDPMLAKIISYAPTRHDAALKLARALESAHIGGIKTNRDFLISCLRSKEFLDGDTTSDFIDRVNPDRKLKLSPLEIEHVVSIAALWIQERNRSKTNIASFMSSGWTNGRLPKQNITLVFDKEEYKVLYKYKRNIGYVFEWGKIGVIHSADKYGIDVEFNGKRHYSRITIKDNNILVHMPYGDVNLEIKPRFLMPGSEKPQGSLSAPMPGKVIALNVKKGSKVKAGDVLVILEAMKMEHSIKAAEDGVVSKILISKNDQVENGVPLMIVDPK